MFKLQECLSVVNFLVMSITGFLNLSITILTEETHSLQRAVKIRGVMLVCCKNKVKGRERERGEHQLLVCCKNQLTLISNVNSFFRV